MKQKVSWWVCEAFLLPGPSLMTAQHLGLGKAAGANDLLVLGSTARRDDVGPNHTLLTACGLLPQTTPSEKEPGKLDSGPLKLVPSYLLF